ncbi:methyltransferase [Umboniibacter marinipuniceus]|uniref:Methyltransferase family protein n=1 Tax=Umboniibacter marinipuniceus TaxID=569599 RepID=A0A3M0A494_9GAMM|nr:methyltransferase [Umboniibacter marinipuniceus]RMA79467.1 methyltransferase family protein [Umboniibacter marinipuniceus]
MNFNPTQRFEQLDQLLVQYWSAWQPTFGHSDKHWLDQASLQTIYRELAPATTLPRSPASIKKSEPPAGMKLRKWQQIEQFKARFSSNASSVVDWCCGIGHLSRHLASSEQSVVGLEIDPALVAKAMTHQAKSAIFHQCDVLADPERYLHPGQSFVALHACGSLHTAMVEATVKTRGSDLHLAPCCYHKRFHQGLKMLSRPARRSELKLTERNIQLAVRQSVTAANRELQAREQLRLYRLGFDEWVKRELKVTHYTPLPSVSSAIINKGFAAFCQWGASQRVPQLANKEVTAEAKLLNSAKSRLEREVAYEAQCELFRRALEIRLCLDNVMFLEENGFRAELIEFCSPTITPRNILIQAYRMD